MKQTLQLPMNKTQKWKVLLLHPQHKNQVVNVVTFVYHFLLIIHQKKVKEPKRQSQASSYRIILNKLKTTQRLYISIFYIS